MMKILFVDIDGPLATTTEYKKRIDTKVGNIYPFNKECVKQLNRILETTGCEIVLHSSWGQMFNLNDINWIFEWNKINVFILYMVDYNLPHRLSDTDSNNRKHQIEDFIDRHNKQYDSDLKYCVLDDCPIDIDNFVLCNEQEGWTEERANKVIEILGKKQ